MTPPKAKLTEVIQAVVMSRYEELGRNKTATARSLGVSLRVLRLWLTHGEWPYKHGSSPDYEPDPRRKKKPPTLAS